MAGLPPDYLSGDRQEGDIQTEAVPDEAEELNAPEEAFDFDGYICQAIAELNDAGVDATRSSQSDRGRVLALEKEITEAANRKDSRAYVALVDEWKGIFLNQKLTEYQEANVESR